MMIRSFRAAFEFERRIFKIDRWRLPVAYGIPLRSIAYALATLMAVLAAGRLPLVGALTTSLAPPIRLLVLPVAAAYGLTRVRVDGRPAHDVGRAYLGVVLGPSRVVAMRPARRGGSFVLATILFAPDERCPRYRRAEIAGPARIRIAYPARGHARGSKLRLEQAGNQPLRRPRELAVGPGQKVVFR